MVLLDALIALPFHGEHVAVGIHPENSFPVAHGDRLCDKCSAGDSALQYAVLSAA
jgi:hypothetical protein